jgi:uncharacterized tellurite resistance protein B-like protein
MVIHANFNDFVLFLYVHMSRADETYDPNEMATIKKKLAKLFDKDADVEKKLYTAIREYNSFNKENLTNLFKDSFQYFGEDQRVLKNNFYNDLNEIVLADGQVLHSETKALEALKEIIELNSEKRK